MVTTIKAHGAADFLGMVPAMLGYQPTESIVAVLFEGTRSVGSMRLDATALDQEGGTATVAGVVAQAARDRVVYVIYSGRTFNSLRIRADDLRADSEGCGMSSEVLIVASDGYGHTGEPPHPLAEILVTTDLAVDPAASPRGADLPQCGAEARDAVTAALPNALYDLAEDGLPLPKWVDATLNDDPQEMGALYLARFLLIMSRPALRDVAIITVTRGRAEGERAFLAQVAWDQGEEYPADLASTMWGAGDRPDRARLDKLALILRQAIAQGMDHPEILPGAYAALAWVNWALGRSSEAQRWAHEADLIEEGHGLAQIVETFIVSGHLPDWAFQK